MSSTAAPPRGADRVVQALVDRGVRCVFALSGNQIMSVFDACIDSGLELVHVRHEAAAVHMADAWGRLTGTPGVALLTAGPGHANALSAMYTALASESPVLVLSGHAARPGLGRGAFQEMPQVALAAQVTKLASLAASPDSVGAEVAAALDTAAAGRPGPVHLSLPEDVLTGRSTGNGHCATSAQEPAPPSKNEVRALADLVDGAERPLLVCGPAAMRGATGAACEALAERLGLPLARMESPRGLRDPCLGAAAPLFAESDLLVLLGKRIDFALRFAEAPALAPECHLAAIDWEASAIAASRAALADPDRLELAVHADVAETARALAAAAGGAHRARAWRERFEAACRHRPAEWSELRSPASGPVHPVELFTALQRHLDAAAQPVLVCDGGEVGQWAQACLSAPELITNGPSGAIGAALPYGIAARAARPDRTVVCVSGDGAFGFQPAEFETAVRANLPIVFVVGNDACWNAENQIQLAQYGENRLFGCELTPARYDLLAAALGAHGEHVTRADELEPALARAFAAGGPACVNVTIEGAAAPSFAGSVPPAH